MSAKNKLITCPYNITHQIRPERIQYHLVKCRKQHPEVDNVVCPYNASHHVPKSDEHVHLLSCPDRRIVEIQKYRFNAPIPGHHGNLANPTFYGSSLIPRQVDDEFEDLDASSFSLNTTSRSLRLRDNDLRTNLGGRGRAGHLRQHDLDDSFAHISLDDSHASGRYFSSTKPMRRPRFVESGVSSKDGLNRAISPAYDGKHPSSSRVSPRLSRSPTPSRSMFTSSPKHLRRPSPVLRN